MCEFLITINTPYTATLLIDGVRYPLKDNKCTVKIATERQHSLEIIILEQREENKFLVNLFRAFKFQERKNDEFCDLIYKTDFKLNSKHYSAKADFEYKKCAFCGRIGKQVDIPYISAKLKKVKFYNSEKTIFLSKIDFFLYIFRHRWLESIIYAFLLWLNVYSIINMIMTYKDNFFVPLEYHTRFTYTPFEEIVSSCITLLVLMIFIFCANFRFFKNLYRMMKFSGDRETQRNTKKTGDG